MRFLRLALVMCSVLLPASGCGPTDTPPTLPPLTMKLSSSAFLHNYPIPAIYTCDGPGRSPPLTISDVPAGTMTLALIVNDPDAPGGSFIHWTMWNIDPKTTQIAAGTLPAGVVEGMNSTGSIGYTGPCPPSGTHHYEFTLYALPISLPMPPSSTAEELRRAIDHSILAEAKLVGTYRRDRQVQREIPNSKN